MGGNDDMAFFDGSDRRILLGNRVSRNKLCAEQRTTRMTSFFYDVILRSCTVKMLEIADSRPSLTVFWRGGKI